MKTILFPLLLITILCSSCIQLTMLQDAKTEGKGNASVGGIVGAIGVTEVDQGDNMIVLPQLMAYGSYA